MYQILFLAIVGCAHAQISLPGTCGNETNTHILNETALAKWQEVQRIPNLLERGQCSTISIQQSANTSLPSILSVREVFNRTARFVNGTVALYLSGRITANFSGVVLNLRILKSDLTNYALVSACRDMANNTKEVYGWKLSRSSTLSSADVAAINAAVNGTDLQNATWSTIAHTAEACKVNSAVTSNLSVLCLLAAIVAIAKVA